VLVFYNSFAVGQRSSLICSTIESVRDDLISILNGAAKATAPMHFAENATLREIALVAQLIDRGYLQGSYASDEQNFLIRTFGTHVSPRTAPRGQQVA
jgi:hypothetical protein